MEALNTNQFYELNKNPTIQLMANQLSQRMSMINSARIALWASLLTSNTIFFAIFSFILNRYSFPNYITIPLIILLSIPMVISLWLFLVNKHSNEEYHKLELLLYERIENIITKKGNEKTIEYTTQETKCKQIERHTKCVMAFFEPAAVFITMFSLVAIVILFVISSDC